MKLAAVGVVEVADLLHLGTNGALVSHMLNHGVLTEVRLQLRMGPIGASRNSCPLEARSGRKGFLLVLHPAFGLEAEGPQGRLDAEAHRARKNYGL
jgi:hypothetical protein